ncbi:MAG: D-tyrosyl-tRNA(Tyr) deacylase [Treponema sp.]|jgi:D-tyrosyl-tRNA(Tyr) deacylase|nr:D-tyrosyl-tRNA(Tyr) deacylase [Treponema sp.]
MKAVVQRVRDASVSVDGVISGSIAGGLLVYLGVAKGDAQGDAEKLAEKIAYLRIFEDGEGKMNLSIKDLVSDAAAKGTPGGMGVLAVSQFTLLADARKGRRPYYGNAAEPVEAKNLYEYFMQKIQDHGLVCEAGVFQAHMEVCYVNDGPVTILLDSKEIFTG